MTARALVFAEMDRFWKALPGLLETMPGKWVVFKNGEVRSAHDTEDEAYWAGIAAFGEQGGHVIARIEPEPPPRPLTAGLLFAPPQPLCPAD